MSKNDPSYEEELARYVECQEVMVRAAAAAGYNGREIAGASLFYYAASLVCANSDLNEACYAVIATYQFIRQNPALRLVDLGQERLH